MEYRIIEHGDSRYITVPQFEEMGLKVMFTTRSMDMGRKTAKSMENVAEGFRKVFSAMELEKAPHFFMDQVHSDIVIEINSNEEGIPHPLGRLLGEGDAMVTRLRGTALSTTFADCVPVVLFDTRNKVHANIHSGWKGTLAKVTEKALIRMVESYGSNPSDIAAIIGPHIGFSDFEIGEDVFSLFRDEFGEGNIRYEALDNGKYHLDLGDLVARMLTGRGIPKDEILQIDLSTYSEPGLLHSYRRDRGDFGLMCMVTSCTQDVLDKGEANEGF
ncbi:polyphenol oxidase family protein [Youngiibacter fragilis]|uniref:Purine nucleoside phosphorylase n=1 Tax=Youngiibacter fragilis 232.1 TaxID=994573 RepID=V7I1V2_9CLOT|nr:polyphenol oxidase family protein [Youngiibacter fragilis]ETA80215.1 hypothetical protein T472_0212720 [Youngiibacter fragilis 232.1]